MKLLKTYTNQQQAEQALQQITGKKRLASERDSTEVVYNLFGQPTWSNFYKLDMFQLRELQGLLEKRKNNESYDNEQHEEILAMLKYAAKSFQLQIPAHWQ